MNFKMVSAYFSANCAGNKPLGPFSAGVDLLAKNGIIITAVGQNTNSEQIELTKLGIQAD